MYSAAALHTARPQDWLCKDYKCIFVCARKGSAPNTKLQSSEKLMGGMMETEKKIAFFNASCDGNFAVLEDLLKQDPSVLDATDAREAEWDGRRGCWYPIKGATACIYAAINGKEECLRVLVEAKANLEEKDQYERTALMLAAIYGQDSSLQLLIQNGAALEAKHNNGSTALLLAAMRGKWSCVEALAKAGAMDVPNKEGTTALMRAADNGQWSCVEALAKAGAKDLPDRNGTTVIMKAARDGQEQCVHRLLDFGADNEAKDESGWTALMHAARNGHTACIKVLLQGGAAINLANQEGHTALHLAAENGMEDTVDYLLQAGARVDMHDVNDKIPLKLAEEKGHASIACKIRDTAASAEQRCCEWFSIQMNALREKNVQLQDDLERERTLTTSLRQELVDRDTKVLESSTQNEQNNLALENELRAELLVYKQQCLESSTKILSLERIIAESFKEKQLLMDENHQEKQKLAECLSKNILLERTITELNKDKQQKLEELIQIRKSCIEQEQEIAVLKNDVASSNNKQSQLMKSIEQLKDKLLVSKNQFLDSSNRNMTLEITIVELKKENELMLEELCQTNLLDLSKERLLELETSTIARIAKLQETMNKKLAEEAEQMICCICMQNKRQIIFLPCGHLCVCGEESCPSSTLEKCPLDDLKIDDRKKVFM